MTRVASSDVTTTVVKRILVPVVQRPITVFRIAVLWSTSVVGGKFGAVVWRNERLIEPSPVSTRRRPLWRGEVRVVPVPASIGLGRVSPERVLVRSTDGVGRTGWVQELFVVAEDDVEEESGEAEFDEEGENV